MTTTEKQRCCIEVCGEGQWGAFHTHKCRKPATILREGKHYCTIHDPVYINKKREKEKAKSDALIAARHTAFEREKVLASIGRGFKTSDLRGNIEEIRKFIEEII